MATMKPGPKTTAFVLATVAAVALPHQPLWVRLATALLVYVPVSRNIVRYRAHRARVAANRAVVATYRAHLERLKHQDDVGEHGDEE